MAYKLNPQEPILAQLHAPSRAVRDLCTADRSTYRANAIYATSYNASTTLLSRAGC